MADRYTRQELAQMMDRELKQSLGAPDSEIALIRLRNLQYYQAEAIGELAGPDVPDRSSIVASDVADTVESMLPSLVRAFAGSPDAIECEAQTPQMEPQAKLASEYMRHILWGRCNGFQVLYNVFKDGLLQKVGFGEVTWETEQKDSEHEYAGLMPEAVQALLSEDGVEPLEQSSRQIDIAGQAVTVYDIRFKRSKKVGRCVVLPVPPEEMRIHARARYGEEPLFVARETTRTRAQLEADGYDLTGISAGEPAWSQEEAARSLMQRQGWGDSDDSGEHERFRVAKCYTQLDQDNDGIAEWRHIFMIGDTVMEDEKVPEHPFFWFCPSPIPHAFFGMCPADQAIEPQRLNTSMMRSLVDNTYLTVNQRTKVVEGRVNLDDLLTNRPGGTVRVKDMAALDVLAQPALPQAAWQMVEWADAWRERRTGFTRYSQGLKADALSPQTAYGASVIAEKDDMRLELIARVAAESVRTMLEKLMRCIARYQDGEEQVRLFGQWTPIDVRQWEEGFSIRVNVGLGVGNKDKRAAALMQVIQLQQPMIGAGMIDGQGAVLAARKFAEATGLSESQELFPPAQPKPKEPDPKLAMEQQRAMAEQQRAEATLMLEREKAQLQANLDVNRQQAEAEQQQMKMQGEAELERFKAQLQADVDLQKARLEQDTQIAIERMRAESRIDAAQLAAQATLTAQQEAASNAAVQ